MMQIKNEYGAVTQVQGHQLGFAGLDVAGSEDYLFNILEVALARIQGEQITDVSGPLSIARLPRYARRG